LSQRSTSPVRCQNLRFESLKTQAQGTHIDLHFRATLPRNNRLTMYPFVFSTFQWGLTAANIMLQFANVATDTLGGLSGQDSIVRASLTPLDASAGLLFLLATCNFVFDPARTSRWCLSRWSLLHSKDLTTRLKLSMRSSWLQITSTTKFVARVKVLQVSDLPLNLVYRQRLRIMVGANI
jgi:hypothetical protein